jgi:hypothetical protein
MLAPKSARVASACNEEVAAMVGLWSWPTARPWGYRPAKREEAEGQPTSRVSQQARPHNGGGGSSRPAFCRSTLSVVSVAAAAVIGGGLCGAPIRGVDPISSIGGRGRRVRVAHI